jgi:plasmid stabilization system protein ParE
MVDKQPLLVIDNEAKVQLKQAYDYISRDSVQNAQKVKSKILASMKELLKHPHKHPTDKYCLDNDGSLRAYELYKYRITYRVSTNRIVVIRVRHTKMNPLEY